MFDKEAYWANRKAGKSGQEKVSRIVKVTPHDDRKKITIEGETFYPTRKQRRDIARGMIRAYRKGAEDASRETPRHPV